MENALEVVMQALTQLVIHVNLVEDNVSHVKTLLLTVLLVAMVFLLTKVNVSHLVLPILFT